eukprot:1353465-Lingulodinium_polyedra.AAC.1
MVVPQSGVREAECTGFPLRIVALCLQIYAMPRVLEAFGSVSKEYSSGQGIIVGCTHAVALLKMLMWRVVKE